MSESGTWRSPQESGSGTEPEFELSLEEDPVPPPPPAVPAEAPVDGPPVDGPAAPSDAGDGPDPDTEAEHVLSSEAPVPLRPRRPAAELGPDPRSGRVARAWRDLPPAGPPAELDALVRTIALEAVALEAAEATVEAEALPDRPRWLLPAAGAAAALVVVVVLVLLLRSPAPDPATSSAAPAVPEAPAVPADAPAAAPAGADAPGMPAVPDSSPPASADPARVADAQALDNLERVIPLIPDAPPAGDFPEPEAVALHDVLRLYDNADFNGAALALVDFQVRYPLHPVSQLLAMRAEVALEEEVVLEEEPGETEVPLEALPAPAPAPTRP